MRRSRNDSEVQVETYRGHTVVLNKATSKFSVLELGEVAPLESVQAAKNAIDRQIAGLNKGVRRKVLTFRDRYYGNDEAREIREGELTSWSRNARGYGSRLQGVVSFGRTDRDTISPDSIFEDTPENRALMARVIELDRQAIKAKKEAERIIEKELKQAEIPAHFKSQDDE